MTAITELLPLLPARMLNEYAYCPRLFFLEWVDREFEDNHFTADGRFAHRRVDARDGALPDNTELPFTVRRVAMSSDTLGVSAAVDLVESDGTTCSPVDFKRGVPPNSGIAHEPEQVQLCVYALLLREQGHTVASGFLYFVDAKVRVEVPITEALVARTHELLALARTTAKQLTPPPPLVASPKCNGCSLAGICMPDEMSLLHGHDAPVRPLVPARDDAQPLYVQEQGAKVGISGQALLVRGREGNVLAEAPLVDVGQVVLWGNVQLSSQALRELCQRDINVAWLTFGGWLSGIVDGMGHGNVSIRRAQYRAADDPTRSLSIARHLIADKILNSRTFLRRNLEGDTFGLLHELEQLAERATTAANLDELLGLEGASARFAFEAFPALLHPRHGEHPAFDFTARSRRPPKDPVNALLSLAYTLLAKDMGFAARLIGLDPAVGFLHQPRHGRPALALDLMEPFRPILADSVVITAINTGVVQPADFVRAGTGVALTPAGRKAFIQAYERRLGEKVMHPVFGYRISYRRVFEVHARLLARYLTGEANDVPHFRTR